MSKITIKFWDTTRLEWVDDVNSDDFLVRSDGTVVHARYHDVMYHLQPIYYIDGERIDQE